MNIFDNNFENKHVLKRMKHMTITLAPKLNNMYRNRIYHTLNNLANKSTSYK